MSLAETLACTRTQCAQRFPQKILCDKTQNYRNCHFRYRFPIQRCVGSRPRFDYFPILFAFAERERMVVVRATW